MAKNSLVFLKIAEVKLVAWVKVRSGATSTVLTQVSFPQMCQKLVGQLWPTGSSPRSSARDNCSWDANDSRSQSRTFRFTQRNCDKWAVTNTASLGEMEIVGGLMIFTCMELCTRWTRRKNGFPGKELVSHVENRAMGSWALCLELILFLELSHVHANNFPELKGKP